MILQKLNRVFYVAGVCLLLSACHPLPSYEPKQNCLSRVIEQCKEKGWHYATTNPDCRNAADAGIYGLSCTELMACRAADQQANAHR